LPLSCSLVPNNCPGFTSPVSILSFLNVANSAQASRVATSWQHSPQNVPVKLLCGDTQSPHAVESNTRSTGCHAPLPPTA
jgi:hypothetical protein